MEIQNLSSGQIEHEKISPISPRAHVLFSISVVLKLFLRATQKGETERLRRPNAKNPITIGSYWNSMNAYVGLLTIISRPTGKVVATPRLRTTALCNNPATNIDQWFADMIARSHNWYRHFGVHFWGSSAIQL